MFKMQVKDDIIFGLFYNNYALNIAYQQHASPKWFVWTISEIMFKLS
jgi:hypothetical protein